MPAIRINVVTNIIGSLSVFDVIMSLTEGGPGYFYRKSKHLYHADVLWQPDGIFYGCCNDSVSNYPNSGIDFNAVDPSKRLRGNQCERYLQIYKVLAHYCNLHYVFNSVLCFAGACFEFP